MNKGVTVARGSNTAKPVKFTPVKELTLRDVRGKISVCLPANSMAELHERVQKRAGGTCKISLVEQAIKEMRKAGTVSKTELKLV